MTSWQHQDWINHGRPDSGLVRPLAQLRDVLRAAGYTVYDWPNDAHLDAEPPEDHTFYSETGWPKPSPKWWRHAIDVMPKPGADGARDLWLLGARIAADRQAGRITWLKYINRPPTSDLRYAIQEAWEPNYVKRGSSDTGHLHLSSITGVEALDAPYNPLIAAGVDGMAHTIDDVYNAITAIANGEQPPAGGHSAVQDWVKTMQSYGAKLDALTSTVQQVATDLAAVKQALTGQQASAPATGDVTVTGTLHLGSTTA